MDERIAEIARIFSEYRVAKAASRELPIGEEEWWRAQSVYQSTRRCLDLALTDDAIALLLKSAGYGE